MKVLERNVVRLVVVQHLRATYGIKTKNWNKNKSSCNKLTAGNSVKVFGVPLDCLPHCHVLDYGDIPCFLADSCTTLLVHIQTEGLFRKSGSVVRLKGLRAKLDQGEDCLFTALPLDVAGLLKQFFRELPEPIVPTELHSALLKAQELPTEEERTKATVLLSCVLPDRNLNSLRYFFGFLKSVAERSADNKMDSSNLAVIFAPNLLHCGEGTEKMNANTEKKLKLMAAVVQCFIENAQDLGVVPQFLLERVPAMLGCEAGVLSPSAEGQEERNTNSGVRMSCRRSLGDMVNGALTKLKSSRTPTNTPQSNQAVFSSATPVIMTPNSKRKLPSESSQSYGFSNKKRRSIKKNLGLELLPNALFGASSTPGSVHSASGTLDSSQNASSSTRMTTRQCASTARRKSKRLSYRNISRVESGKAGCFSPRVTKKEAARKSLRLRFSLGRSSRDSSVISHSIPVPKGSETIGWRLATQESVTAFHFTKDTAFSPTVLRDKSATKGSKYISKSEDNLLTPQCDMAAHRSSWNGETPDEVQAYGGDSFSDTPMSACLKVNYSSEPAIVVSKPPIMSHIPKSLCCATSAESVGSSESLGNSQAETWTGTGPTLLKIKKAFSESGSDLHAVIQNHGGRSETAGQKRVEAVIADDSVLSETPLRKERSHKITEASREPVAEDQNVTFGQIEIVPLSPLHLNSTLFETGLSGSSALTERTCDGFPSAEGESTVSSVDDEAAEPTNCSRLVDALDIQSPASFRLSPFRGVQSTPCNAKEHAQNLNTSSRSLTQESAREDQTFTSPRQQVTRARSDQAVALAAETRRLRVADHVQRFNMMTLNSPRAKVSRSPLKFQRTPVRQSVRRINSLVGERKQCTTQEEHCVSQRAPVMKAVSLESGLCTGTQLQANATEDPTQNPKNMGNPSKTRPPVLPRKPSARLAVKQCALGDVTNTVPPRAKNDLPETTVSAPLEPPKSVLSQVTERDTSRYRGSPKNPLVEGRLVSVCRPIDL